jgi:hypothetical protein
MNYVLLHESEAVTDGADNHYLYIRRVGLRGSVCEITVCSGESMVELYLNDELKYRQKGSGEFVFCAAVRDLPGGELYIKAQTLGENLLTDELKVKI